ncbi:MAG: translocation/assembly module TamB domain-containing protein, partial [Crocinitomicaceae bacterium]
YKEGNAYYGKAYVTGTANIFGYTKNLEITVNATTQKGTVINFPMYGQADIAEENGFIQFVSKDTIKKIIEEKINFSSVSLDLNFNVTEDAQVKIIFDENTGDEITSNGNGKIRIGLDQQDQLSIEGVYTVKSGEYNFAMGPVKKNFYIEEGGTVQWTGDPYDAALNLRTYYLVSASLSEVMTTIVTDNSSNSKDLIYCYLDLGGSLSKPSIAFDLAAPRASESGKTTLNRIKSTQDELNTQFFSLLLFRKFQPLAGSSAAKVGAGNAAFEVISNQINSVLDKVSKDYKLSVKLNNDETNKQNTYEFGVSKGFLDDRLILSGNFGVNQVNAADKQGTASNFIGDVNLEYKLNESGSFRVNVFNQSNQYDIISKKNLGLFTQGVGLHYQESFSNINDFKLIQFVLDLFRKPENRRYLGKKKNKRVPIPKEYLQDNKTIKNEEDSNS